MADVTVPPIALLTPLFALGCYIGYRRSWRRELLTGSVLVLGIMVFDSASSLLLQVVVDVARAVSVALTRLGLRSLGIDSAVAHLPRGVTVVIASAAFLLLAYWLGAKVQPASGSRLDQLGSVLLGAVNMLLLLAFVSARYDSLSPRGGSTHRAVRIELPALPPPSALSQWTAYAAVAVMLLAVVWGASHVYRIRS